MTHHIQGTTIWVIAILTDTMAIRKRWSNIRKYWKKKTCQLTSVSDENIFQEWRQNNPTGILANIYMFNIQIKSVGSGGRIWIWILTWIPPVFMGELHKFSKSQFVILFYFFRATPMAYGGSQARGRWEPQLLAYTRATATPDPSHISDVHHSSQQPRILNPLSQASDRTHTSWFLVGFDGNSLYLWSLTRESWVKHGYWKVRLRNLIFNLIIKFK